MSAQQIPPYILLVDPNRSDTSRMEEQFRGAGWRYDLVEDGRSLLDPFPGAGYDVVVADVELPGIDPAQLIKNFTSRNPSQAIIVLGQSGSPEHAISLLRSGALDYLQKPVDPAQLQQAVQRIVAATRKREAARKMYNNLTAEAAEFVFTTAEAAVARLHLPLVDQLCARGWIDETARLKLELAFQEAVANALEHGNLELESRWREEIDSQGHDRYAIEKRQRLQDPRYSNRKLYIRVIHINGRLEVRVRDEGQGFSPNATGCGPTPTGGIACHGRGMAIIQGSVDKVLYVRKGTEVRMIKYLDRR